MDAATFFKTEAKKANLTDSIIYVYDTVLIDIMERYADHRIEEERKVRELAEFHDEDFGSPVRDHFSRED